MANGKRQTAKVSGKNERTGQMANRKRLKEQDKRQNAQGKSQNVQK
jgi:hypothetical protein